MSGEAFDVGKFIDGQRLGRMQILVLTLCVLVMMCDGYDVFVMGFVLQPVAKSFGVTPAALTSVFVLQNIGLAVGTLVTGPLADRFGRRRLMIGSVAMFSLLTLATSLATSPTELIALRFASGLFFAGLIPNAIAITSEFAPARYRATLVTWMFIGYTGGAALGGAVVTFLVSRYGWQAAFWVGGGVPLVLTVPLILLLPESVRFRVLRDDQSDDLRRMLRRMDPAVRLGPEQRLVLTEEKTNGSAVTAIFRDGRALMTGMVWIAYFTNLMVITIFGAFLPTFLTIYAPMSADRAAGLASLYSVSAMIVSLGYGRLIDRYGAARILAATYCGAALALVGLGMIDLRDHWVYLAIVLTGAGVVSGQNGLNALGASVYPTSIRATGVGWAFGAGRLGGMVGPILGGLALSGKWSALQTFSSIAVPMLVAAASMVVIALFAGPRADRRAGGQLVGAFERDT